MFTYNKNFKIQLKIESFYLFNLEFAIKRIYTFLKKNNIKIFGSIFLPKKNKSYCVLRSPHIFKDAREHFEITTYSCILEIYIHELSQLLHLAAITQFNGLIIVLK